MPMAASDVEDLRGWAGKEAKDCLVVTTQKDLVKLRLPNLGGQALWALRVGLHFEAGQECGLTRNWWRPQGSSEPASNSEADRATHCCTQRIRGQA